MALKMEIPEISGVAKTYQNKQIVHKVYDNGDGTHKIVQQTFTITTYDLNGKLSTVTNNHQINYLV